MTFGHSILVLVLDFDIMILDFKVAESLSVLVWLLVASVVESIVSWLLFPVHNSLLITDN